MLKLGPIASTRMMCSENLRMNFEHDFVKVLGNSHDWALNGNALQLLTDAGDTLSFGRRH
jgi:heat shock protein HslJ